MLGYALSIYERLLDIGGDKADVVALSRRAFITEAFYADDADTWKRRFRFGPNSDTLAAVTRAWKRYQQQHYPSATRHHAEFLVSFWGSLLLRFYPQVAEVDLSQAENKDFADQEQLHSARTAFAEFRRALGVLFPSAQAKSLAELPKVSGIGARIGCLCMLSHAVYKNELADFLIERINKWQDVKTDMSKCRDDLIPKREKEAFEQTHELEKQADVYAWDVEAGLNAIAELEKRLAEARIGYPKMVEEIALTLESAEAALKAGDPQKTELEKAVADARIKLAMAKAEAKSKLERMEANLEAEKAAFARNNWNNKQSALEAAAKSCRVGG
jgi:hypothetical protein